MASGFISLHLYAKYVKSNTIKSTDSRLNNAPTKPDAYILIKNSILTLSHSQDFKDFIKTDQLIQKYLIKLPSAQRYQILEIFLVAVADHILVVDGDKKELSRHDNLFLDTMSQEYQPTDGDIKLNLDDKQDHPNQKFTKKLLNILPIVQKKWLSQALKHDFEVLDIGEGYYTIRLNPNYIAKRFAPFLPEADHIFIKALAEQNQEQFYYDATIDISWQELGERAIFWENYTQQYPNAYFLKDAKALANYYLYYFIHGMGNSMTVEYFDEQENKPVIESEAKQAFAWIKNKYPNSNVSQKIKLLENSMVIDKRIIEPVEPTERSTLMGQL